MNIIACRPVVWEPKQMLPPEETPIYPGSIKGACSECNTAVYIGPRQKAVIDDNPEESMVLCFLCTIAARALEPWALIIDLGNRP